MRAARSSQRRRRGPSGISAPTSSFTDATSPGPASDAAKGSPGKIAFTGIGPGWLTDPSGRHEQRYWSGSEWTEHVSDGGVPGTDPPPLGTGREPPS
ncbi:MAG TPA: DUF2510 domain-containing protein [Acidimicrobiales bacterium]|nr:DUF2510 domain-containing protein [Acidimicrobiales bacterium]